MQRSDLHKVANFVNQQQASLVAIFDLAPGGMSVEKDLDHEQAHVAALMADLVTHADRASRIG